MMNRGADGQSLYGNNRSKNRRNVAQSPADLQCKDGINHAVFEDRPSASEASSALQFAAVKMHKKPRFLG
jgi:hypothetical protein